MLHDGHILAFLRSRKITRRLPKGVGVLNPYLNEETFDLCKTFYRRYYHDEHERYLILGINPGRLGAGLTGIPFTDPAKLEDICGISNSFQKKTELSADFIYTMIDAYGGAERFYSRFYISSVSPLGFIMEGRNLNYYDIPALQKALKDFIRESLHEVLKAPINRQRCYCLGEGQNFKYLTSLNAELKLFDEIVPLSHPRFIMQYKRKTMNSYIDDYLTKFSA